MQVHQKLPYMFGNLEFRVINKILQPQIHVVPLFSHQYVMPIILWNEIKEIIYSITHICIKLALWLSFSRIKRVQIAQ